MTKLRPFFFGFLIAVLMMNQAWADDEYTYLDSPGCILHKYANGSWGTGPLSDMEGQKFSVKPYGKFGTQWSAKVNGTWYYADKTCFKQVGLPENKTEPMVSPTPSPSPSLAQKTVSKKTGAPKIRKKYGVDLSGSYWMMMSNSSKAQSKDFSVVTAELNKLSAMMGGKARFTYMIKPAHELSLGLGYTTGSRDGTIVGGASDSKVTEAFTDTEIALGYRYLFGYSSLVPFVGLSVGYNMLYQKETIAISATNGAGVGYSGSGIGYGINFGTYYMLGEKFRLVGDLSYSMVSAKVKVADTTDPATFATGTEGGTLNLTHLGISLGLGYCF